MDKVWSFERCNACAGTGVDLGGQFLEEEVLCGLCQGNGMIATPELPQPMLVQAVPAFQKR